MSLEQHEIDTIYHEASTAEALTAHPGWELLSKHIQLLKDEWLGSVLSGLPEQRYRQTIGAISALDDVLRLPGELVSRRDELG